MSLTAPFSIDTDYTFQLGGSNVAARGDSTTCFLQIKTLNGNSSQFSNITPSGATNTVGYWRAEPRTFNGNTIRLAVVGSQGQQPVEEYLEFRFSVGAGNNGCASVVTNNPGATIE